ncbi:MAG TPA: hypothetical protein VNJ28_03815 [Candidatus Limnocylindrales bacterium]|nr:hypothetical protein [Candidatus Limnocylindrales bacterium]
MLTITEQAAALLTETRRSTGAPESYGIRLFAATPPGGEAPGIVLTFVAGPEPGDQVTEQHGLKAFVAPELSGALDDATLDATTEGGVEELVLSR